MESRPIDMQSWRQLTSIYVGGALCLPVILIGQELCQHYGLLTSLCAILIGNMLLLFLGLAASAMGTSCRKNTMEHAETYFGRRGAAVFALVMIISMLSWFAIQLNMMSLSIIEMVQLATSLQLKPWIANIILGTLITILAKRGMKGMSLLSDIGLPVMIVTLGWAVFSAQPPPITETAAPLINMGGISLVMAASIAVVIDTPTFFRYARTPRDGTVTTWILFCVALPVIEGIGVYLAASMPGATILETLNGRHGLYWNLWVAAFLLLAGWTTNNTNLFSAIVCMESLYPKGSKVNSTGSMDWKACATMGSIGTVLALGDPLQHIEGIINLLGICIGSMGGVMLTSYLLEKKQTLSASLHMVCWGFGVMIGVLELVESLTLSSIPLFDAYIGASIANGAVFLIIKLKRNYETAYSQ